MKILTDAVTLLVAALHIWFLVLEMFLWRKPIGIKAFRMSPEKAEATAVLAANQGLYNGFLAAGLLASFVLADPAQAQLFRVFFFGCVAIAGLFGAYSVSSRIFFIQALPAFVGLGLTMAS